MTRGLMLASALVVSVLAPACTTPYRIDVGSAADDGGALDGGGRDTSLPFDGGPDSPDTPDAFTCSPSCIDAMQLSPCAGEDPIDCPLGCIDGPPAHCGEMVVANVQDALAAAAVNGAVVAADAVIDTTECMWPSPLAPINGQIVDVVGGVRVCLFVVASLSIPNGAELRAVGANPLVIVSEGEVQIMGDLSVDSRRAGTLASTETLGAGSGSGGAVGMPGMGSGTVVGGGGGGGFATNGGRGGNSTAGVGGTGGEGGLGAGYLLEPLVGGARGGAGGGLAATVGGPGGGAMQITSRTRIVSTGYLGASGAGGARAMSSSSGGAGGGSGGAILLEAPEILLAGDVNVSGGGGGTGGCAFGSGTAGNDGANQTSTPSGGDPCPLGGGVGGRGAGGTSPEGTDAGNGSGGGGGAGVVRIHVRTPLILPGGARLNPRIASGLYTVDSLVVR